MREGIGANSFRGDTWWEKSILKRYRHKWRSNIKTNLQAVGWRHDLYPVQNGTGVGLLWMWWWTFGFHKSHGISCLSEDLLCSLEGLCSIEVIGQFVISSVCVRVWQRFTQPMNYVESYGFTYDSFHSNTQCVISTRNVWPLILPSRGKPAGALKGSCRSLKLIIHLLQRIENILTIYI